MTLDYQLDGLLCARSGHSKENAVDAFLNR